VRRTGAALRDLEVLSDVLDSQHDTSIKTYFDSPPLRVAA
jgi:hypothetical protein